MSGSRFAELRIEQARGAPRRVLTVDVEDWYHSNFRSAPALDTTALPRAVEAGVDRLLEAFAQVGARATFFVLGEVAREHAALVPRIAASGHEIACHGWQHALVYEQSPEALRAELERARGLLQEQSGQPVLGFRAPSWSVTERSLWALDVAASVGFAWDSSIFPMATYLYGIDRAPRTPYHLTTPAGARLLEIPPATIALGPLRVGVGGGMYLRALPLWVHRRAALATLAAGHPFVVYTHPREFAPETWNLRLPLSSKESVIHRLGLAAGARRLHALLRDGPWEPAGAYVTSASGS